MTRVRIAFTGTRLGMTEWQQRGAVSLLDHYRKRYNVVELHHGCCVGSDAEIHLIAMSLPGVELHGHPAGDPATGIPHELCEMGLSGFAFRAPMLPPLERDDVMAKLCDAMIATPASDNIRGGTWKTIRMGVAAGKLVHVLGRKA